MTPPEDSLPPNPAHPHITTHAADDGPTLWIQFDDGWWTWVDIAGWLETHERTPLASPSSLAHRAWQAAHELAPSLLRYSTHTAITAGIELRALRQSLTCWYRPLALTGKVPVQTIPAADATSRITQLLHLTPEALDRAHAQYAVDHDTFCLRLHDLIVYSSAQNNPAHSPLLQAWPIGQRTGDPALRTPWTAIQNGHLSLVEWTLTTRHPDDQPQES